MCDESLYERIIEEARSRMDQRSVYGVDMGIAFKLLCNEVEKLQKGTEKQLDSTRIEVVSKGLIEDAQERAIYFNDLTQRYHEKLFDILVKPEDITCPKIKEKVARYTECILLSNKRSDEIVDRIIKLKELDHV